MDSNPIRHASPAKKIKSSFLEYISSQNRICHPSPKKIKCSFLGYIQLLVISQAGWWTGFTVLQLLIFGWLSTSGQDSATTLQPKKWNAHFWITFNFWWLAGLVNGLEPHLPPLSSSFLDYIQLLMIKKIKCSFLGYIQLLVISQAGWWTGTPSATVLQLKK